MHQSVCIRPCWISTDSKGNHVVELEGFQHPQGGVATRGRVSLHIFSPVAAGVRVCVLDRRRPDGPIRKRSTRVCNDSMFTQRRIIRGVSGAVSTASVIYTHPSKLVAALESPLSV